MKMSRSKLRHRFAVVVFLCFAVLLPQENARAFYFSIPTNQIASAAESTGGFFCEYGGFLLSVFGLCESAPKLSPVPSDTPSTPEPAPAPDEEKTTPSPATAPPPSAAAQPQTEPSTTTTRVIRETPTYVTNEYTTNPTTIIRETIERGGDGNIDTADFVTRSLFDAQVDATHDSFSNSDDGITDSLAESITTDLLTVTGNGTLSGTLDVTGALTSDAYFETRDETATSTLRGALSVGTSTSRAALTLDGGLYLGSTTPTQTASRLYNQNGSLYWAGNIIAGTSVGTWEASGGNVYRSTGNVGIGTDNPGGVLTVDSGDFSSEKVIARFTYGNRNLDLLQPTVNSGFEPFIFATNNAYSFQVDGVDEFVIDEAGIIGVGTSTPLQGAFGHKFQVYRGHSSTDLTNPLLSGFGIFNPNTTDDNFSGIALNTHDTTGSAVMTAQIGGVHTSHTAGSTSGELAFLTRNAGTISEKLRITSDGNVGIGTTSPSQKLYVDGNIRPTGWISPLSETPSSLAFATLVKGETFLRWKVTADGRMEFGPGHNSPRDLALYRSGTSTLRINPGKLIIDDMLGIGTTSPVSKLSVEGTMSVDGLTGSTGAGSLCLTSNNEVVFNSGSDACLPSLRETKHDIETLDVNALDMVSKLESVSFKYNMESWSRKIGQWVKVCSAVYRRNRV